MNVLGINCCGDLHKAGQCVLDELLVGLTEVRFLRPFSRLDFLVFHATTPAHIQVATEQALIAKIKLSSGESAFLLTGGNLVDWSLEYAA